MKLFQAKEKKRLDVRRSREEEGRRVQEYHREQLRQHEAERDVSSYILEVRRATKKLDSWISSATKTGQLTQPEASDTFENAKTVAARWDEYNKIRPSYDMDEAHAMLHRAISKWTELSTSCRSDCVLLTFYNRTGRLVHGIDSVRLTCKNPSPKSRSPSPSQDWKSLYKPLTPWQTRLVELHRSDKPGLLPYCRMRTVELADMHGVGISGTSEVVHYTALSYSWGRGALSSEILCEGVYLPIPDSLAKALIRLADKEGSVYLWCDAICINQDDHLEKSRQVRNMLRIFEKADKVIAWLGEPTSTTGTSFFDFASEEYSVCVSALDGVRHRDECHAALNTIQHSAAELCKQAWFTRTWVRQEVFATKNLALQLGGCAVPYEKFIQSLELIFSLQRIGTDGMIAKAHTKTLRESGVGGMIAKSPMKTFRSSRSFHLPKSFWTLQDHFKHGGVDDFGYKPPSILRRYTYHWLRVLQDGISFDVSDERDRVYGVLGIIQSPTTKFYVEDRAEIRQTQFPLSYDKSVSEVYQDVVKHLINTDRNLDVLAVVEDRRDRADDLPSWVPDWRHKIQRHFLIQSPEGAESERKNNPAPLQDHVEIGKLQLEGIFRWEPIYTVNSEDFAYEMDADLPKYWTEAKNWYPPLNSLEMPLGGTENVFKGCAHSFLELLPNKYKALTTTRINILVPRQTQLGDNVVKLKGSPCLHVLRRLRSGEFMLIGPSFAWGRSVRDDAFQHVLCLDQDWKDVWDSHPVEKFTLV